MLPVALLVGLDVLQSDACRSAFGDRARVIAVADSEEAVKMITLHRPKLVVMRTEMHHGERRIIGDLVAKLGGRIASVAEKATPASVERLVEGFAAVSFDAPAAEPRVQSGTRSRVSPGEYHSDAQKIDVLGVKKR